MSNENIAKPDYRRAAFLTSAPSLKFCPPDFGAEVAFAGRSNAGKSSAINTLTGNKKLARTSKTPGRTQLFNCFEFMPNKRLVDLPGYGYAKAPKDLVKKWRFLVNDYLRGRAALGPTPAKPAEGTLENHVATAAAISASDAPAAEAGARTYVSLVALEVGDPVRGEPPREAG